MATTNGSTAIRDKILASLARYRALRIGKFPCAFWRLSARPGLTASVNAEIKAFCWFIYRFNSPALHKLLMDLMKPASTRLNRN
ncbi:hypothetical protein [Bathymodiolus japonicus methanotrophic gill symbiont]|uniref:hypothetical protein n=1 Tax=Bathymodiolus japonicus methanotrophic gill symbiont TaxID=113269 RepID=UPI001C8D50B6|nr:hypothetical protein [Bathymodiolus japonicus methanotrophic gill symbiont]